MMIMPLLSTSSLPISLGFHDPKQTTICMRRKPVGHANESSLLPALIITGLLRKGGGYQSIGVPSLRRGWRPCCAICFYQVPSHSTVPYSFSSSRSRCQSNSVLCLFFLPPCPPTLIFVGNGAFLHVHNRPFFFLDTQNKFRIFQAYHC